MLTIVLVCAAVLLALAPLAVARARSTTATQFVYGVSIVASAISLVAALMHLLGAAAPETIVLPVGVPWLGAHLRLDALSAFFLVVIDLGAMSASLFALGYGQHETAPGRVLPFYPAFLAAMTLVLVADDAYTFLLSWEFMSLTSWALVMAHHRVPDTSIWSWRASGRWRCCWHSACSLGPRVSTPLRRSARRIPRPCSARWRSSSP
jgi:hydrogenase-4 component B